MSIQQSPAPPVAAFTIHRLDDPSWLPDGEVATSYAAYDQDGRRLVSTWSLWESCCLSRTRDLYPNAIYVASVKSVKKGARL